MIKSVCSRMCRSDSAFSLVEITITLGILSFCVLSLFALLPTGLSVIKESSNEGAAMNLLTSVCSDLRNTSAGQSDSMMFGIPIYQAGATPRSGISYVDTYGNIVSQEKADFRLAWSNNKESISPAVSPSTWIRISWPAQDPGADSFVETLVLPSQAGF